MASATESVPIALRLIGAPRLSIGERVVALGSRKAIALLALLTLDGECARARLAALLWPDQNDADARRNLRREVFRLRNAGVPIDEGSAHSLALSERPTCDALSETPGPGVLLDGFDRVGGDEYFDWLTVWRARLAQRGRASASESAAALERRGDVRGALALHLGQLDLDPINESAAQQALRLYAALGERDAALALFARLESQLRQQLGLSPLPATLELVQGLRKPSSELASPSAVKARRPADPAQLPLPSRAPLAGRLIEIEQVLAAWQAGQTVFVAGPPGVGKSRLASECAMRLGAALFVGCRPDDGQLPYSAAVRALRLLMDAAFEPDLPDLPAWVTRELTRLLPELGDSERQDGSEPPGDEARMRLFEAYAQAWIQLTSANFSAIVIDDWQFADPASVQVWDFVDARERALHASGAVPVRRLFAFRSGELAPAAMARVRQKVDSAQASLVALSGLAPAEVQALVQQLAGQSGATLFSQRLHSATDGNPLFILETIRHLFEKQLLTLDPAGGWRTPFDSVTADYAELPVPPSARDTIVARARAFGDGAARLLEAASLAGDTFDLALLAGTTALDGDDTVSAIEHAQAAQILRGGADGTYRFAHDLFRQCVADSLSPARRALLHARLARNLVDAGGLPARIADHFERAALPREAAPWYVRAGADAARVLDFESALSLYARALAAGLDPAAAYDVHDRRVALLHRLYRTDEQLAELDRMAALARATADTAAPYELALKRAVTFSNSGRSADALALARWAAAGAPPGKTRVRAHYLSGVMLMFMGDDAEAKRELLSALTYAPAELPEWEPIICSFLCHLAVSAGELDQAVDHYERGLHIAAAGDRPLGRADVLNAGYRIAEAAGDRAEAVRRLQEAIELAIGVNDIALRVNYMFNLINVHLNGGDLAAARDIRAELMRLIAGKTEPRVRFMEHQTAGRMAVHAGDLGAAWTALHEAARAGSDATDVNMQRIALIAAAHLAADCGAVEPLQDALDALAQLGPHPSDRHVLIEEVLQACATALRGAPSDARARLESCLGAAPATARSADPEWQENSEWAQVGLGFLRALDGDPAGAREAVANISFSPSLRAAALAVRLRAAGADGEESLRVQALALLGAERLTSLDAARLACALASIPQDARHAKDARSQAAQRIDALAATLAGDSSAIVALRTGLLRQRPA